MQQVFLNIFYILDYGGFSIALRYKLHAVAVSVNEHKIPSLTEHSLWGIEGNRKYLKLSNRLNDNKDFLHFL